MEADNVDTVQELETEELRQLYNLLGERMEEIRAGRGIPARESYEQLKAEMETWEEELPPLNERPFADLQTKSREILSYCHTFGGPFYLTDTGTEDMVLLSASEYKKLARYHLEMLLGERMESARAGNVYPALEAIDKIIEGIDNGTI